MLHIVARTGDHVVAALPEDVDLYSTPFLRAVADRIIDEGCRHLTLDASRTLHLDSTGVTALIAWYQRLDPLGGSLAVTGLDEHLYALLTRLGLNGVITLTGPAAHDTPRPQ
ncbi:STAS domain-containing protein [Streptomyces sp. NRRL S-31]|uniref:STAS domain-containing protein n=1 Tax=Streptomyces sp. NRRL S-31 TaxID=1463898 RepID=UPI00069BE4C3|nr:STAS domain-containing protein [Streptomyces sp. NRRL S-31]